MYFLQGKVLLKLAQRQYPKLSVGQRDVMREVRRVYGVEKTGVRLKVSQNKERKLRRFFNSCRLFICPLAEYRFFSCQVSLQSC